MKTLRSLIPFTKGRRLAIGGGLAGSLLVTASELARPFPLKLVVDWVFADPDPQAEGGFLVGVGALVLGIAVVGAVGGYLVEAGMRRAGEHVVHDLRVALYAHLQRLTLRFHHCRPTGDLVTRITGDVNSVRELVAESLIKVVSSILLLAGMLTVSAMLDPVLTLAAAAVTPILAFATVRSRRAIKRAARHQRNADGDIASISTESLAAITTVKALGTEVAEHTRLREKSEERRDAGVRGSNLEGRFSGLVHVLEAVGTAVVLVLGVVRVSSGALTPGDLVIMHSYVRRLYRPLHELARQSGRIARAMARADRIVEVLGADDHLPEAVDAHRGPRAAGHLELRDVSFSYRDDRPVLDGASIDVEAGSTVAIVGPSGAGKSTLATLIARFHDPDSGAVLLDGRDLRDCHLQWLRDQVGFVLQHTALFSGTVADNIAYGTDASRPEIVMAAQRAGAHEFIDDLPEGYDTVLGPDGIGLSGGQAQRVAIARVLLRDPAVVVLDEPTSGLDAASEATVINSLDGLLGGRTTILITHSLRLARRADRVVVLDRGRIAEQGRPRDLLAGHGLFRQLATQQGLAAAPRLPAPPDEALTQLPSLLDPSIVAEALSGHMSESLRIDGVTLRYVRYKPCTNVVADYDVVTGSGTHRAVLMAAADRDLTKRAARPRSQVLADKAADRAPERAPLGYLGAMDVLLQWLPLDVWLPALAEPPEELVRRSGVSADRLGDATLLAYKPRRRAVLGIDGHVFKLYADEHDFRAATTALMSAHRLPIRTASPTGVAADLRLTAQRRLDGMPISDPVATAPDAGSLLAELHRTPPRPSMRRLDQMDRVMATAGTVAALLPQLSKRVDVLVGELAATAPDPGTSLCHGDFHMRQLLEADGDLALIDLDDLGIGQPASDLATYAAHLIDGTPAGIDRAEAALEGLVVGYGQRPQGLRWHLSAATLRRAVFPFRTYPTPDWPDRIESMITAAERVVRS